jgi:hypothetical protein
MINAIDLYNAEREGYMPTHSDNFFAWLIRATTSKDFWEGEKPSVDTIANYIQALKYHVGEAYKARGYDLGLDLSKPIKADIVHGFREGIVPAIMLNQAEKSGQINPLVLSMNIFGNFLYRRGNVDKSEIAYNIGADLGQQKTAREYLAIQEAIDLGPWALDGISRINKLYSLLSGKDESKLASKLRKATIWSYIAAKLFPESIVYMNKALKGTLEDLKEFHKSQKEAQAAESPYPYKLEQGNLGQQILPASA